LSKVSIRWAEPSLDEEEKEALKEVIDSTWIGGNGPKTREFEKEFARTVNARYALAVNNGTSALMCALLALREKYPLFNVIVPTFTFIATANVPRVFKIEMELVDARKDTWNLEVPSYLKGDVIMAVDVGGLPCDYDRLKKTGAIILEDAAEAVGGIYRGKKVGSISDITTFSFHSAKVMSTGEGGMITTNNKELYQIMKSITNQGYPENKKAWEYEHPRVGLNFRMTEMQSALGLVQLKKLSKFLRNRREIARIYKEELKKYGEFQRVPKDRVHPYFLFGILVEPKKREKLIQELRKNGIGVKVTWKPVHLQRPYKDEFSLKKFTNAEYLYKRIISLPIHNKMNEEDAKEIVSIFKKCWRKIK